jgi:RNA polymerase sigma-70 factor (ECF subfamily)
VYSVVEVPGTSASREGSFDEFFRREFPRLVGQAYLLVGSQQLAEDLTQEALARAWVRWGRVSQLENPEAWARRVLYNLALNDRRWRRRRHRSGLPNVVAADPGPEDSVVGSVIGSGLLAAVLALPADRRRALVLHDVAGVSVDEIAAQLGVPSGTVRSWLSRDRSALAERLRLGLETETERPVK